MRTVASIILSAATVALVACKREQAGYTAAKPSESAEKEAARYGIRLSKPGDVPFVWASPDSYELKHLLECLKEKRIFLAIGSGLDVGMATFDIAPEDWEAAQRVVDAKGLRHTLKFERKDPPGPHTP